jgi:hypothetical protein
VSGSSNASSVDLSSSSASSSTTVTPVPVPDGGFSPSGDVLTQHNDSARTGANPNETCLTPSNVTGLDELAAFHLDGEILAQPLVYTPPGGSRRLLVMASTANELAAFDLETLSSTPVWEAGPETFGTPGNILRWQGQPLGILSTPVIDPVAQRVYVLARSCPSATSTTGCPQAVHAFDVNTGVHLASAVAQGSLPPSDSGTDVTSFNPDAHWNRPGLLLQNGELFVAWACAQVTENEPSIVFNGWVMAFDTTNLATPPSVYVTTPHNHGGGIWQAGGGLVGDGQHVYFNSGNGMLTPAASAPESFPTTPRDQENSMIRLGLADGGVTVASYFDSRPYHSDGNVFQYTNAYDYDMSSSGLAWIPGTDDLVGGSKGGIVYLVDRTTMAQRQTPLSPFTATPLPSGQTLHIAPGADGPEVVGSPAVWRRTTDGNDDAIVYMWPRLDHLTAFHYDHATTSMTVAASSSDLADSNGGMLSFSINGSDATTALLWVTMSSGGAGLLRAYDPTSLSRLFEVSLGSSPNYPGNAHYIPPTIADGRVFAVSWLASGGSDVTVFGVKGCGG